MKWAPVVILMSGMLGAAYLAGYREGQLVEGKKERNNCEAIIRLFEKPQ